MAGLSRIPAVGSTLIYGLQSGTKRPFSVRPLPASEPTSAGGAPIILLVEGFADFLHTANCPDSLLIKGGAQDNVLLTHGFGNEGSSMEGRLKERADEHPREQRVFFSLDDNGVIPRELNFRPD